MLAKAQCHYRRNSKTMLVRVFCNEWAFYFRRDLWNAFYNLRREPIQTHLTFHRRLSDFKQEPIRFSGEILN